ncbi:MAG TPA: hypothetical protein VHW66_19160 [Stellaceae bacterium]|jgi:SOS-response transcriptional repressor LexA|nr:hypothetical protein [Stellaceae bacterium]
MADDHAYGLTRLQRDCLLVIQEIVDTTGAAPSIEELRQELDLKSRSQAQRLLRCLRERGYLTWPDSAARSITVLHRIPYPDDFLFEVVRPADSSAEGARP